MLESQRLELRLIELRSAIAAFPADGETTDLEKLTTEFRAADVRKAAALISESGDAAAAAANGDNPLSAELREYHRILDAASGADFVAESAFGVAVDGASAELRAAANIVEPMMFPIDVLSTVEMRADAVTGPFASIEKQQQAIIGRLFAQSATAYLGVEMPSVGVGEISYVLLNAGATADVRSDGVALDAAAATLTTETIAPVRATTGFLFGVEDTARIRGLEDSLTAEMRGKLTDKMDALSINGQAAVANTSPAVEGIIRELANPTNPSAVADYSDYLDAFDAPVDGKYAAAADSVRMLVNNDIYRQARGLVVGSNTGNLLRDRPEMGAARFRVSANMPDTPNNEIATAITYTSGTMRPGLVMPVWRGAYLVRDPYSDASSGRVRLTLTMLTGFKMIDPKLYRRLEFQVA